MPPINPSRLSDELNATALISPHLYKLFTKPLCHPYMTGRTMATLIICTPKLPAALERRREV